LFPITIDNETKYYREKRKEAYKNREQVCNAICAKILLENQQQSLAAVTNYVRKIVNRSYTDDDPEFEDISVGIIPAAWVVIGASGNDAAISFRLLLKEIEKDRNAIVTHLEPTDAESEKKLLAVFFSQILPVRRKTPFKWRLRYCVSDRVRCRTENAGGGRSKTFETGAIAIVPQNVRRID
jgi:hypothetical protein